jgi:succinate dehydrogenase/fumarate reductase flavoprotein subunit
MPTFVESVKDRVYKDIGVVTPYGVHAIQCTRVRGRDFLFCRVLSSLTIWRATQNMSESASSEPHDHYDCIVIGSGHAGSCAALSAAEHGCPRVLLLDKCPETWAGGNGFFTAGAHRTVHRGLSDLLPLVENVPPAIVARIDVEPYTAEQFTYDIMLLSGGRSDVGLVRTVVQGSRETLEWLKREVGVPFTLSFNRQAYEVDGRQKFWGGMALSTRDGGKGLIAAHRAALGRAGVETWFEVPARELICKNGAVVGVVVEKEGKYKEMHATTVVLAAGGYESNAALRKQHLGQGWENARVSSVYLI